MRSWAIVAAMLLTISGAADADQVHFTGQTRANSVLMSDILKDIALIGRAQHSCASPDSVQSELMPKDFTLANAQARAGAAQVDYERWSVSFCGKVVPYVIAFWPAPDGGMTFLISESMQANPDNKVVTIETPSDFAGADFAKIESAANAGDANAEDLLGNAYSDGRGVKRDYALSFQWYMKAAEAGHSAAQNNIGRQFEFGLGMSQDLSQAAYWYGKAAAAGNAIAELNLGALYASGRGVPLDYSLAMQWWRKSADAGNADAQYDVGALYYKGAGVPQDYVLAMQWWQKSAAANNPNGQRGIGDLYQNGYGVPKDLETAKVWFRKAAQQGDPLAQRLLLGLSSTEPAHN